MIGNRSIIAIVWSLMLVMLPIGTIAGPAILSTAEPNYSDPLSSISQVAQDRLVVPDTPGIGSIETQPGQAVVTEDSNFTIIGDQSTDGLNEPEVDDLTRSVRDEILGRDTIEDDLGAGDSASAGSAGSTADIVRALVNAVPGQERVAGAAGSGQSSGRRGGNGDLVASVIDATVTELVITLLNPEQAADGMVTFSIAGFGDFALLHLQENNSFFVVDLESGAAMKVARGARSLSTGDPLQRSTGKEPARQVRGKSNALQKVLSFLEDNILPFVQSPITLAALGLFSIIWIIWRLSSNG